MKLVPSRPSRSPRPSLRVVIGMVAVVLCTLLCSLFVTAPAHGETTVSFPSYTSLNPDKMSYPVTINGTGFAYRMFVVVEGNTVELPTPKAGVNELAQTLKAFADGRPMAIRVDECNGTSVCQTIATSPQLSVFPALMITANEVSTPRLVNTPQRLSQSFTVKPVPPKATVTWQLLNSADQVVIAKTADYDLPGSGALSLDSELPELPDGSYSVKLIVTGVVEGFGELTGVRLKVDAFTLDRVPPTPGMTTRSESGPDQFFPYPDRYADELTLSVPSDPVSMVENTRVFEVVDPSGAVVRTLPLDFGDFSVQWNGRNQAGALLPDGEYVVRARFTDRAGNSAVASHPVRLRPEQAIRTTIKSNDAPKGVVDKLVEQRCARITSPARPGWKGSLAFRSHVGCRDEKKSVAAALTEFRYDPAEVVAVHRVRVGLYGAPARRGAYINQSLYSPKTRTYDQAVTSYRAGMRWHWTRWTDARRVIVPSKDGRYVSIFFATSLTSGSAYDVKRLSVEVTCTELVMPGKRSR